MSSSPPSAEPAVVPTTNIVALLQTFSLSLPGGAPPSIDGSLVVGRVYVTTPLIANRMVGSGAATNPDGPANITIFTVTAPTARGATATLQCSQDCEWWVQVDSSTPPHWHASEQPVTPRQVAAATTDTYQLVSLGPGRTYSVRAVCVGAFGTLYSSAVSVTTLASPVTPP